MLRYDVCAPAYAQRVDQDVTPTHLHYFTTPAIFTASAQALEPSRLALFRRHYMDGFRDLVEALLRRRPQGLGVLYPSSGAVADCPKGLETYAQAKLEGEGLCAQLVAAHPGLAIEVTRLPRLRTDQTAALQAVLTAYSLERMLSLIHRVQGRGGCCPPA